MRSESASPPSPAWILPKTIWSRSSTSASSRTRRRIKRRSGSANAAHTASIDESLSRGPVDSFFIEVDQIEHAEHPHVVSRGHHRISLGAGPGYGVRTRASRRVGWEGTPIRGDQIARAARRPLWRRVLGRGLELVDHLLVFPFRLAQLLGSTIRVLERGFDARFPAIDGGFDLADHRRQG